MATVVLCRAMNRKELPGATSRPTQRSEHVGAASNTRDGPPKSNARGAVGGRAAGGAERAIRFKTCLHNTIGDVLRARGWQEVKEGEGEWDFYWCDVAWMREHFDQIYLEEHQRVCHFRNHYELTRSVMGTCMHSAKSCGP